MPVSKYKTRQRDELLEYLKNKEKKHVTVNDISEYFNSKGKPIGIATIYRQLDKMVTEGIVNKYNIDSNCPACFEYVQGSEHNNEVCFHYKCEQCGKLMHMNCEEFSSLQKHLLDKHKLTLDLKRTVFYGICSVCSENKECAL